MNRYVPWRPAVVLLLVCSLTLMPAVVAAQEDPRFEAVVAEQVIDPGFQGTLDLTLRNDAADVEDWARTAREVRVSVEGDGPIAVRSGPRLLGRLGDGEDQSFGVRVAVPEDAPAGTYDLTLVVTYVVGDDRERQRVPATVRIDERARLRIVESDADLTAGEAGTVSVTVANDGSAPARDVRLRLESGSAHVVPDAAGAGTAPAVGAATAPAATGGTATRFAGTLAPGERRTVRYATTTAAGAPTGSYGLDVTAAYENVDGRQATQRVGGFAVTPRPQPSFVLRNLSGRLRVGEEGTLDGAIRTAGDRRVRGAVVRLSTDATGVTLRERTVPLGALPAEGGATFSVPAVVAPAADPGPRGFTATVEYVDGDGDVRESDPLRFVRRIAPERDRLRVAPVNATVAPDGRTRLVLQVTNVGDVPLSDVRARLAAAPPFSSDAPRAYAGRLAPDETARLAFDLAAAEDAVEGTASVGVNLTAEMPSSTTLRSGPRTVPVTIAEPTGPDSQLSTLVAGLVVVLALLGAGWWWLRR